jgi:hypothetical protein
MYCFRGSNKSFLYQKKKKKQVDFCEWMIVHRKREQTSVAHELAPLAKRTRHSAVWCFISPICVEHIVARERNTFSKEPFGSLQFGEIGIYLELVWFLRNRALE